MHNTPSFTCVMANQSNICIHKILKRVVFLISVSLNNIQFLYTHIFPLQISNLNFSLGRKKIVMVAFLIRYTEKILNTNSYFFCLFYLHEMSVANEIYLSNENIKSKRLHLILPPLSSSPLFSRCPSTVISFEGKSLFQKSLGHENSSFRVKQKKKQIIYCFWNKISVQLPH